MDFKLLSVVQSDMSAFKRDMQEAFQKGFEDVYGKTEEMILPEKDIDRSLNVPGSIAYKAVVDGEMMGGAVVVIDEKHSTTTLTFCMLNMERRQKASGFSFGMQWRNFTRIQRSGKPVRRILRNATSISM